MSPRPIGELISTIFQSDDIATFGKEYMQHMQELYTYSKNDIVDNLGLISFAQVMELRNFLVP